VVSASVSPRIRRRGWWSHFAAQQATLLLAVAILLITVLAYLSFYEAQFSRLPSSFAWDSTITNALPLVFVGVGQGIVVLTRGLDLSVGGTIDLTNSLAATHMHASVGSMISWSLIVLVVGAVVGAVNGLLVTVGRLQPIVVTIGTMSILQGIAAAILPQPGGSIPAAYTNVMGNTASPVSLLFIGLVLAFWLVLRRRPLGVALYAIGNDPQAAAANGVNVARTRVAAYVLSGVLAAAAGLFLAASSSGGDATGGDSYLLSSFAAVVLGGVSFFGGRGSMVGVVCGAGVLTILVSLLFYAHVNSFYESFYQGVFLVGAVLLGLGVTALTRRSRPGRFGMAALISGARRWGAR
jgi:ribose transport system permease protein